MLLLKLDVLDLFFGTLPTRPDDLGDLLLRESFGSSLVVKGNKRRVRQNLVSQRFDVSKG